MKKLFSIICLCFILCITACSKAEVKDSVDFDKMKESMIEAAKNLPEMSVTETSSEDAQDNFEYLFKIDYKIVEKYSFVYSAKGTAEEIGVFQLKDEADAEELKGAIQKHIQSRTKMFETYAPEQVDMNQTAVVISEGRYVALIICENPDDVRKVFKESIN